MEPKFNHLIDVAFEIVSEHEDWTEIDVDDLLNALEHRLNMLRLRKSEAKEAFGLCDTYEV